MGNEHRSKNLTLALQEKMNLEALVLRLHHILAESQLFSEETDGSE